ncbi:MAG: hypothetical protein CV045_13910, partial [Cyanobacteria bacterium M5B4]
DSTICNTHLLKTDTLFYKIFQTFPQLVFQLLDRDVVPGYAFTSVEVKEKSFRFDGIFMPPIDAVNEPIYFIEVQFQPNPNFLLAVSGRDCSISQSATTAPRLASSSNFPRSADGCC